MANVIYVGNYPTEFTDDDISDIFKDFDGLVLLRSVKKGKKCYSFILCHDQEQVIEVVFALNGTTVCGRDLIVRASDDELQEIIDQCDDYDGSREDQSSTTSYRQPWKPSCLAKVSEDSERDAVVCESRCYSRRSGSISPSCSVTSQRSYKSKGEKFSFVSIVNFPDGTTREELQEMFSDYHPVKIIIQNKVSDADRLTEAVICFFKRKDATSSIMNLDNTLYNGRVILVTECDDISFLSDLVKLNQH